MDNLDTFTRAYIECALWSTNDNADESGGEPLDANYSIDDIAPETLKQMEMDCADFYECNADYLADYPDKAAGHDFWLTREHHGAGFWEVDYGTKEQCDRLTANAHAYGGFDLCVGDDGKIYA